MPRKLIIEVRLNEYAQRLNPNVPWTADEIVADAIACHRAGASAIHFHARKPDGTPENGFRANVEIVRRIREQCDVIIHPTLGASSHQGSAAERLDTVVRMAREGLVADLVPLDFVTTNIDKLDVSTQSFLTGDRVYTNTTATLEYFARNLREIGIRPYPVIWSVPGLRQALAFFRSGLLEPPMFMQLMLSSGHMIFAHPGTVDGIDAYTNFIPHDIPIEWNIVHTGGSVLPLVDHVVRTGGNLCFGLGDHPYTEHGAITNAELVQMVSEQVRARGREIATPDEARLAYGIKPISA